MRYFDDLHEAEAESDNMIFSKRLNKRVYIPPYKLKDDVPLDDD
jgi:hypothetical protein